MHNNAPPHLPHPARVLRAGNRTLELGGRPWLMGIVNASPDSFSDDGSARTLDRQARLARELVEAGADMLDVGGESARTGVPPVSVQEEIERVVPLVERIAGTAETIVSVDTYKPAVARPRSPRAPRSSTTSPACATPSSRACAPRPARRSC